MKKLIPLLLLAVAPGIVSAAEATPDSLDQRINVFSAGEITVVGKKDQARETVTAPEIEKLDKTDIAKATNLLPGVNLGNAGARNEGMIYVRGFDMRQVPLYVDGIPLYVPYDGYIDPNRFTTYDLSEVTVSKGCTSVLYGPNTMGGAINMVSLKPQGTLDAAARTSLSVGDDKIASKVASLNVGSNQGLYYIQAGLSVLDREFVPLSGNFDPNKYENGGKRDNSATSDFKGSVKVGYTPNSADEYALTYINHQSDKGVPVYLGSNPSNPVRYWKFADWDKSSLYFIGNKALGDEMALKARLYYDNYYNVLDSYDDATYTTQKKKSSFTSIYDDNTYGGSLEFSIVPFSNNTLKLALHDKYDMHKEYNVGETPKHFEDNSFSVAAENTWKPLEKISIIFGIRQDFLNTIKAEDIVNNEITSFDLEDNSATSFQLSSAYQIDERQQVSAYLSRTTRFPTLKDRYSYRMGRALPNPGLDPEQSWNYGIDYTTRLGEDFKIQASIYQSKLSEVIQQVNNVAQINGTWVYQFQNTGEATFTGFEFSGEAHLTGWLNAMLGYSYIDRKNDSKSSLKFTDVPRHKVTGYVQYLLNSNIWVLLETEYNTKRYSTTDGKFKAGGYAVFNLRANTTVLGALSIQVGIQNLFDRNYEVSEGYPEPGRQYTLSLGYSL
ncbi:MAG: TonB-dependent receptor [Chlorobiales bacterium]|nr:TonB-dependent receptor [Chlorobiales bacterium]